MKVNGIKPKKLLFTRLTLELKKTNPERYEYIKIKTWEHILKQGMAPTKWLKPNKHGTAVHFKMFIDESDLLESAKELKAYVETFNTANNKQGV